MSALDQLLRPIRYLYTSGTLAPQEQGLDLIAGAGMSVVNVDDSTNGISHLTLSATGATGGGTCAMLLTNGVSTDVTCPATDTTCLIAGPSGPFSIAGIAAGVPGQKLRLLNLTGQSMTIKNKDSTDETIPANMLWCATNADIVLPAPSMGFSYVDIQYLVGGYNLWAVLP
jgi:hypothetical protein